ncbi:MAG: hypothetical protein LBG07_12285 [Treponema sp.]|jgi:hypothetical protein|nr:hypothetical protein [Treponema sp.]
MKKILFVLALFVYQVAFAEGPADSVLPTQTEEDYQDYGSTEGVTFYDTRSHFPPELTEAYILIRLNGLSGDREQFIKEDLLKNAGFRSTANVKFRKTNGAEKAISVLYGINHAFSLGLVPMSPFFEVDYARLAPNNFYTFQSIVPNGQLEDISPAVRTAMELEYMLQVEFSNGILIRRYNVDNYTEENIAKFETLALSLPDDVSPELNRLKDRYLNEDLPRIRAALERYKNPSELATIARRNLSDILVIIRNDTSPWQNARKPAEYYY